MVTENKLDMEAERQLTQDVMVRLLTHNNAEVESGSLFGADKGHREVRRGVTLNRLSVVYWDKEMTVATLSFQ